MTDQTQSPVRIDLFADIVCPWCFIGTERIERVIEALGGARETTIVHHPFILRPDLPPAGISVHDMLRRKYGVDPRTMFARVEAVARESDLLLDLSRQPMCYPTARGHTLIRHAEDRGTQRALVRALFRAYFFEARNIYDLDVLVPLAVDHGFSNAEAARLAQDQDELDITREASDEAHRLGIQGAPFFVFNGKIAVSGAQPESVLREAILSAP
jgi:predicted DsbA family dithiol-disulfide isomerase